MSVMIASADTISKVANLIYCAVEFGYNNSGFSFSHDSTNTIRSIWGDVDCQRAQRIYEALQDLNRNSYETRYKESDVDPFIAEPYRYKYFKRSAEFYRGENGAENVQKLKSVQFLKYQCADHDNSPQAVKLYRVLSEIVKRLSENIIDNMELYKSAKWE